MAMEQQAPPDEAGDGGAFALSPEHGAILDAISAKWPKARLLAALSDEAFPPDDALAAALLKPDDIACEVMACMDQFAAGQTLPGAAHRLMFRGLFALGGARYDAVARPLLGFLRAVGDGIDDLLGDAVTDGLNRILAGVYDGDLDSFAAALLDPALDTWVRGAMVEALVILARMKRIARADAVALLARLESVMDSATEEMSWYLWSHAVELLALGELVPAVERAFADGRVPPGIGTLQQFRKGLAEAEQAGEDETRFERERLHSITDIYEELSRFGSDPSSGDEGMYAPPEPVRNPLRHVGRNDPCPCGSGRKYKKCCLGKDGS
jgi:hypothetical protein